MPRPEVLTLLAHRRFAYFFAGRTVSTIGSSMAGIALTFAVLDLTGSASALGLVLAAPAFRWSSSCSSAASWPTGLSRSFVMQASHLLSAATQAAVATLLLTGVAEIWMLVVLGGLNGTAQAFTFPAMQGIVPLVVPRSQIQQANALLSFSRGSIVIVGPSLGAVLVVTIGSGWALAVDAASFLLAAFLMSRIHLPPATLGEGDTSMLRRPQGGLVGVHVVYLGLGGGGRVRADEHDPRRRVEHARPGHRTSTRSARPRGAGC